MDIQKTISVWTMGLAAVIVFTMAGCKNVSEISDETAEAPTPDVSLSAAARQKLVHELYSTVRSIRKRAFLALRTTNERLVGFDAVKFEALYPAKQDHLSMAIMHLFISRSMLAARLDFQRSFSLAPNDGPLLLEYFKDDTQWVASQIVNKTLPAATQDFYLSHISLADVKRHTA